MLEIKAPLLVKGLTKNDNRTIEHLARGIAGLFGPAVSRSGARAAVAVILTPGGLLWPLPEAMANNAIRLASSGPSTLDVAGSFADGDPLPTYVPPGPNNPLGPFKFTLGTPGYLIHGSNKKFGIGMRVSHGCFRMLNNNVLELAGMAPVGTKLRIINEPYKFGVSGGKVYLEAHAPLDDHGEPSLVDKHTAVINALLKRDDLVNQLRLDWDVVREVVAAEDGLPIEIAVPDNSVASTALPLN